MVVEITGTVVVLVVCSVVVVDSSAVVVVTGAADSIAPMASISAPSSGHLHFDHLLTLRNCTVLPAQLQN